MIKSRENTGDVTPPGELAQKFKTRRDRCQKGALWSVRLGFVDYKSHKFLQ